MCGISHTPNLFTPPHQQPFSHNKRATHRFCANLHGCLDLCTYKQRSYFLFILHEPSLKRTVQHAVLSPVTARLLFFFLFCGSQRDTFWNCSVKLQATKKVVLFHCGECVFTLDTDAECLWSLTALVIYSSPEKMRRISVFAGLITI